MMAVAYRSFVCVRARSANKAHDWRKMVATGWYVCANCGQAGVCLRCLAAASVEQVPFGPLRCECERHVFTVPEGKATDGTA